MAKVSKRDLQLIAAMRKFGVLADVNPHRLDQKDGVIMVPCADGDQMPDLFTYQIGLFGGQCDQPRVHTLSLNGGALLIPETSPLNKKLREDLVYLEHIRGGAELKGISTVVIYTHVPCGMAAKFSLDAEQCIGLLLQAKERIKRECPGLRVACFCHVDREGKKRTYFVSEEQWADWRAKEDL